ncbi:uncharacterized protein LOC132717110 [Ruditapes philippinarum]|uniref:uncharacterized protein LOC132717110 n=1 Tax=Ruditapes philippinarum TaxID=129788 RepID=UPI00295AFD25|nr:uncharacterized protein LOC132717110 [Ruditapes philippinarum]
MACLIHADWPVQYNDEDPENGNEAEYKADGLKNLIVKESKSAKQNVVVCFVINLIVQTHLSMVDIAITDTDLLETLDVDTSEANSANNIFKSLTNVYAPLALFLMSKSSYRTTVAVGSLLICVAFANISFLNKGPEGTISWYWQVWLCGPVALGVSCLKLGAMIPVLEYFKRDRMKALVITRIGTVLGASATIGIKFADSLSWRTLFRINAGLCVPCLAIAFILKDIVITEKMKKENDRNEKTNENKEEDEDKKGCSGIIKEFLKNTFRIPVLKDKTFWITVVVFFFFSFGTSLPTFSLPEISSQMQEQLAPPVDSFYEVLSANVGTLLGLILTYLLKSLPCVESYRNRKRNMGFVFSIITLSGYIMAILSIVTQENFVYYIIYILVLTIFEVLTENFRDESMPPAFGRFNIRLTQGFLQMSVGLGGLSASAFQNGIDKADNDGGWKLNFRLGGGFLLISGSITGVVLAFDFISKRTFLRHSCFVNILTDGTITKRKPAAAKTQSKCCTSLCCIKYQTITEKEDEKPAECTDCSDGCTAFNCPRCLTLSCCLKKRPSDRKEAQSCDLPCTCCKGFSLSCFSICCLPKKRQNINKEAKQRKCDFNCCKTFSPTCFPKCLPISCISKKRSKSEKDEKGKTKIVCKGCSLPSFRNCFKLPCSSKKRLKSQSDDSQQTSRKEPLCSSKCFPMPCLARKESYSKQEEEVRNSTENEGCSTGFPKCLKFPCSSKKQPMSQNKLKQHRERKELSCTPKCCSIPFAVRKRSYSDVDEGARNSTEQEYKGCTPPSFPKCFSCPPQKRQKSEDDTKVNESRKELKSVSGTETKRHKRIFPPSCCLNFQVPACLPSKKSRSVLSQSIESDIKPEQNDQNVPDPVNDEYKQSKSKRKGFTFSSCFKFPTKQECLSPKQSSSEINTSLQEATDQENAKCDESNKESEPKRSISKRFTFSSCLQFRNIQCLIPKSSSEMSSPDNNTTFQQSPLQDKSSTSELVQNESKYRGSILPNCLRFQKLQCLSPNKSDQEILANNTTAHEATDQNNTKVTEPEIKSKKEKTPNKGFSFSRCLSFPNKQCFSQESLSSENQTAPTKIEDHIEEIPKQDKSACKGMTLLRCGTFPKVDDMSSYESNLDNVTSTDTTALQNDTKQDKMAKEEEEENFDNSESTRAHHSEHKSRFNCFHGILCQSVPNKVTPISSQYDNVYSSAKTPGTSNIETSQNLNIPPNSSKNEDKFTQSKTPDPTATNDSTTKAILFNCCPQFQKKHVYLDLSETSSLSKQQSDQENTETDTETLLSNNDLSETRPGKVSTPKPNSVTEQVNMNTSEDKGNKNKSVGGDDMNEREKKDKDNNSVGGDDKNEPEKKDKDNNSVGGDDKNKPEKQNTDNNSVDGDDKKEPEKKDKDNNSVGGDDKNKPEKTNTDNNDVGGDDKNESEKKDNNSLGGDDKNKPEKTKTDNNSVGGDDKNKPEKKDNGNISVGGDDKNKPEKKDNGKNSVGGDDKNNPEQYGDNKDVDKDKKKRPESEDSELPSDTEPGSLTTDRSHISEEKLSGIDNNKKAPIKPRSTENGKGDEFDLSDNSFMFCQRLERAKAPPTKPIYRNKRLEYEASRIKRMSQKNEKTMKSQEVSQTGDKITDQIPTSLYGKNSEGIVDDNTKHHVSEYEASRIEKMFQKDKETMKSPEVSKSADKITGQSSKSLHDNNPEGVADDKSKRNVVDESKNKVSRIKKMPQKDEETIKSGKGSKSANDTSKEQQDFEEELFADCPRYERALAPPYEHVSLNRRLQYEAKRIKSNNEY